MKTTNQPSERPNNTLNTLALQDTISSRPPRTLWGDVWRQFRRHRLAMFGGIVIIAALLFTMAGPFIYQVNPRKIDFSISMAPPSLRVPFGADDMGHDLLARAMWGGRISIAVGVAAMLLSITIGTTIGAISGFFGGLTDSLLMRFTDLCIALPRLPLLLLIIFLFRDPVRALVGPEAGIFILIVSLIGILGWMTTARVVRASFLSVKNKEFVEAAVSVGARKRRLIVQHILPNVMSPIIVSATIGVAGAILTESSLSFLGLGFPPDVPTWGRMLFDGRNYLDLAPHMAIVPGMLIFLVVLSINFMGDGLRDALDPRHRGR